jgi:hypothetical protein
MKRSWNWRVWAGFGVALVAAMSYVPVFARFPITRDFPWVNLLLFLGAVYVLAAGLRRAFAQPQAYRGKISGTILTVLSLALFALFAYGTFVAARQLPSAQTALRVGQQAADFTLTAADGTPGTLSQLRQGKRAVLLIFYRGYW